jgi:hypothetical protein
MFKPTLLALAGLVVIGLAGPSFAMQIQAPHRLSGHDNHNACTSSLLTGLRIVRPATIAQIGDDNAVLVRPVCDGEPLDMSGNTAGLRDDIAGNEWLVAMLDEDGYTPEEVVGIAFGANDSVHLYVHHVN